MQVIKVITVVATLIEKDNKYLIARRSTGSEDVLGKWEFPGGKVEKMKLKNMLLKEK